MKIPTNHYLTVNGTNFTMKVKHSRWYIAFSHNSKRINRSTGLEATKKNLTTVKKVVLPQIAQELLSKTQDSTTIVNPDEMVIENFWEVHYNLYKETVRLHVAKRNELSFKSKILPYFKGRELNYIKPMELEAWQNNLLTKYKYSSVKKYRSIFYGLFTRAYQNELVTKNPFDTVASPKMKNNFKGASQNEQVNPFTQQEIDVLVAAEDNFYMRNFIKLMANSGIRPGELIALTWADVDFNNRSINIDKTIINSKIGLPKTPSSVRVIDMIEWNVPYKLDNY